MQFERMRESKHVQLFSRIYTRVIGQKAVMIHDTISLWLSVGKVRLVAFSSRHLSQASDGDCPALNELSSVLKGAPHSGSFSSLGVGNDSSPIAWVGGSWLAG